MWVFQSGKLIPKHLYRHAPVTRSDLPAPMIISDSMEYTINHADGRQYGSKRAFEKAVRAAGCEIVGNERVKPAPKAEMPDPIDDILQAVERIEARPAKRKRSKRGL